MKRKLWVNFGIATAISCIIAVVSRCFFEGILEYTVAPFSMIAIAVLIFITMFINGPIGFGINEATPVAFNLVAFTASIFLRIIPASSMSIPIVSTILIFVFGLATAFYGGTFTFEAEEDEDEDEDKIGILKFVTICLLFSVLNGFVFFALRIN